MSMDMKALRKYAIISGAYLLLSILLFYPMILNITSSVPGSGGDVFQSLWDIWWVPYSLFTLHASPYFSSYVFYPVGANLATQTFAPIAGLVSAVFQPIGVAFAYNIVFLIGFVLAGLFAFLLAHHFTKNDMASFIAGFVYAFGPMHVIQSFGHLQFINIEFIPLFLLFFLKMIEERKPSYAAIAGVSFVLLSFMGDIEQGLMTILLAFFVLIYFAATAEHRKKILDVKFGIVLAEMAAVILIVGSPFIIGVAGGITSTTLSTVNAQANSAYNTLYSPDLLSFFIPSSLNGLLSPISSAFSAINAPAASERTAYAGFTVLALAAIAIAWDYKDKFKHTGVILVPLILFALLSIGPVLQIGGSSTGIPGLYAIYNKIPYFNVLREPGRFDMMVELLLGILAALGFAHLESKYLTSASVKRYAPVIIILLLLLEFNAWPTSQAMMGGMYANATIPKAYSEIGTLTGNFSVLMLPALPNPTSATPALYPGMALYYQTAFKHPLVGGYTTRVNTTQTISLINIPIAASAYYLQTGQGLVYGSPIIENYTNVTNFLFGAYNIGFVAVNEQAFNKSELESIGSYLTSVYGAPVYNNLTTNTMIFGRSKIINTSFSNLVSYTPVLFNSVYSIWQPGWVFCTSSTQFCNTTNSNRWYAMNPVYINVYNPSQTSEMRVNVTLRGAYSPTGSEQERVYLDNQLTSELNLTTVPRNYTFRLLLNRGVNQLVFYVNANLTGYANMGLSNMTISR